LKQGENKMIHSVKHYWLAREAKLLRKGKIQYSQKRKLRICEKAFYRFGYRGKLGLNNWEGK
jgi:hypothetical protein